MTVGLATPPLTVKSPLRASTERAAAAKRESDGLAAPVVVRSPLCQSLVLWSRKTNQMNMSVRESFFANASACAA